MSTTGGVRSRLPHNAGHSTSNYTSALSPAQSLKLDVPSDSVDPAVVVPLSPVQSHKLDVFSASVHPVMLLCPVQSQKHDDSADLLVVVPLSPVLSHFTLGSITLPAPCLSSGVSDSGLRYWVTVRRRASLLSGLEVSDSLSHAAALFLKNAGPSRAIYNGKASVTVPTLF